MQSRAEQIRENFNESLKINRRNEIFYEGPQSIIPSSRLNYNILSSNIEVYFDYSSIQFNSIIPIHFISFHSNSLFHNCLNIFFIV